MFTVHPDLLKEHSDFLGGTPDTTGSGVALPEINYNDFHVFVHWLYTKEIDHLELHDEEDADTGSDLELIRCYVLGETLKTLAFKNAVVDALVSVCLKEE